MRQLVGPLRMCLCGLEGRFAGEFVCDLWRRFAWTTPPTAGRSLPPLRVVTSFFSPVSFWKLSATEFVPSFSPLQEGTSAASERVHTRSLEEPTLSFSSIALSNESKGTLKFARSHTDSFDSTPRLTNLEWFKDNLLSVLSTWSL